MLCINKNRKIRNHTIQQNPNQEETRNQNSPDIPADLPDRKKKFSFFSTKETKKHSRATSLDNNQEQVVRAGDNTENTLRIVISGEEQEPRVEQRLENDQINVRIVCGSDMLNVYVSLG